MSITNSSAARRAGFKVNDKSIKELAAIAMTKFGTRTLRIGLPAQAWHGAGAAVAITEDGIFNTWLMPDANAGNLYTSVELPAEWVAATNIIINIYWKSAAVTGNAKFSVEVAGKADAGTTVLEETVTVTTAADVTANKLIKSSLTFAAADFTAGDLIGIHIQRDPADVADTLTADLKIVGVEAEFTGQG